jgi:hypothetical protein
VSLGGTRLFVRKGADILLLTVSRLARFLKVDLKVRSIYIKTSLLVILG